MNGNQILINGEVANSYTFDQNYYWMMGDNRHRSEDSRFWGYVPEDHIVGTPIFIWMSIDGINDGMSNWKVRWDRVFTTVNGDGEPTSYFKYFLILLAAWFIFDFFRKRRKWTINVAMIQCTNGTIMVSNTANGQLNNYAIKLHICQQRHRFNLC